MKNLSKVLGSIVSSKTNRNNNLKETSSESELKENTIYKILHNKMAPFIFLQEYGCTKKGNINKT